MGLSAEGHLVCSCSHMTSFEAFFHEGFEVATDVLVNSNFDVFEEGLG